MSTVEHEVISVEKETTESVTVEANLPSFNPSGLLEIAVQKGTDFEQLEKLIALEERWKAGKAKEEYMLAVAAFKKNPPIVTKDRYNKQYESYYTSLANLVNTVNKGLGEFGLSAHWSYDQTDKSITVTCILSHAAGHSEKVSLSAGPDTSGKKNPIQEIKSTTTYLRAATFEAVTGTASVEVSQDDDGNGSSPKTAIITEEQQADIKALLDETKIDLKRYLKHNKLESLSEIPANKYNNAIAALENSRK